MPLFLVTLPLVLLPMQPGFELSLGTSLVPLTGIVLLLKAAIEGDYFEALRYFLPVTAVTAVCCLLAIRWAIDQFNKESVLFRESERFGLGLWLRHLVRDRRGTPTEAAAVLCGVLILAVKFLLGVALLGGRVGIMSFLAPQLICLGAALAMTAILARSPTKTLLLRRPKWWTLPAAVGLAAVMHPVASQVSKAIEVLYPFDARVQKQVEGLFQELPSVAVLILVVAVVAPVCEELAFRGFMLSGFRHLGRPWMAILLTSVFFGMAHPIVQQSLFTFLLGIVITFVAVQTGSLLPAILYHMTHNGLMVGIRWLALWAAGPPAEGGLAAGLQTVAHFLLGTPQAPGWLYHWAVVAVFAFFAALLLRAFANLPHEKSEEESLQEVIRRQALQQAPAA
jgi:sodium transport system permease protein